jgi:hypothetical protein
MPIDRECRTCGKVFQCKPSAARRYCSLACVYARNATTRHDRRVELKCLRCGNGFLEWPSHAGRRVYCSETCRPGHGDIPVARECKTCGKAFQCKPSATQQYCSRARAHRRNNTTRNCQCCGKPFRSPPSQMHVRTCSPECGYKISRIRDRRVEQKCKLCGNSFFESPSRASRRVYCSTTCQMADPDYLREMSERTTGPNNPMWTGTGRVSISASGKRYNRTSPELENAKLARRRGAKKQAAVAGLTRTKWHGSMPKPRD